MNEPVGYYVYCCYVDNEPRYIGMGSGSRYKHCISGKSSSQEVNRAYFSAKIIDVVIIWDNLDKEDAQSREGYLINSIGLDKLFNLKSGVLPSTKRNYKPTYLRREDGDTVDDDVVRAMVVDSIVGYDLLELGNGNYGAMWFAAYGNNFISNEIVVGDYHRLPFVGDKISTCAYLKEQVDVFKVEFPLQVAFEEECSLNRTDTVRYAKLNPKGVIARTLRCSSVTVINKHI